MMHGKRSLWVGGIGALLLSAGSGAGAQDPNVAAAAPVNSAAPAPAIGHPQLRDFSLTPQRRIVTQPPSEAQAPAELAPPPPTSAPPRSGAEARTAQPPPQREVSEAARPARPEPAAPSTTAAPEQQPSDLASPTFTFPEPQAPAELPGIPAEAPAPAPAGSASWLYYALSAAALALVGLVVVGRRRRVVGDAPFDEPILVASEPPKPRPDPVPRPWLELSLKAERASFTASEASVEFELEISNTGGSAARNLRIDVKMFNAGVEQDREIGAFFRSAGRESTKLSLPVVEAGVTGFIKGHVTLSVDEMRAVKLDERLLFIPVVAVNALYDRDTGLTGQTSRSYVVGRELQTPSEKMGAFRVDQGPRIWRTIGQREHKLAKRV